MVADEIRQFGVQVLQKFESIVHKEHLQGSGSLSGGTQTTNLVREVQHSPNANQLAGWWLGPHCVTLLRQVASASQQH